MQACLARLLSRLQPAAFKAALPENTIVSIDTLEKMYRTDAGVVLATDGNAETNNNDDGAGTMECIYFGTCKIWGYGNGTGPWVRKLEHATTIPHTCT